MIKCFVSSKWTLGSEIVICLFAVATCAQSNPSKPPLQSDRSPRVYEDDEIKIPIPDGWAIAKGDHPGVEPYRINGGIAVGSAVENAPKKVLLEKGQYILALAYETMHASGVEGGRFIEMLRIPWLDPDEAWDCSLQFMHIPQPASRKLMFISLLFPTGDPKVREKCGIEKDLGEWTNAGGSKEFVGEYRWFAGYLTTQGGWFFESEGNCQEKTYSLTSKATEPEDLPDRNDRTLKQIINEAIDIVDSIEYKRCAPL